MIPIVTLEDIEKLPGRWSVDRAKALVSLLQEAVPETATRITVSSDICSFLCISGALDFCVDGEVEGTFAGTLLLKDKKYAVYVDPFEPKGIVFE